MVEAEEGNSWIYKNKDHGKEIIYSKWMTEHFTNRNVVRGCEPWSQLAVGYRNGPESCRQIHLLLGGVYQSSHFTFNSWSPLLIRNSQAGAFLATGILNTGVRSEADAVLALLGDHIINKSIPLRTSAIIGLGFAYAGSHREDILFMLLPLVSDDGLSMEIVALSALAVGLIFVGSENGEAAGIILQTLMEREDRALDEKWTRFLGLGLALLYVGQSRPE